MKAQIKYNFQKLINTCLFDIMDMKIHANIHKMTETKQRWERVLSIYDSLEEKVDKIIGKNNVYQCFLYELLLQPTEYLNKRVNLKLETSCKLGQIPCNQDRRQPVTKREYRNIIILIKKLLSNHFFRIKILWIQYFQTSTIISFQEYKNQ